MTEARLRPGAVWHRLGSLGRQSVATFGLKAGYAALAIGATLCAARLLSLAEFGAFSLLQSVAAIVAVIVTFGTDQSSLRESARAENRASQRAALMRSALLVVGLNAAVVLPLVWLGAGNRVAEPALVAALIVTYALAVSGIRVARGTMVGSGRIVRGQLFEMALHPAGILAAILVVWSLQVVSTAQSLFLIVAAVTVLFAVWAMVDAWYCVARAADPPADRAVASRPTLRRTWAASFPFLAIALGNAAMSQVDIVMLGALASADAAGIGRVLIRIADFAPFLLVAAAVPASRWVARLKDMGDAETVTFEVQAHRMTAIATLFAIVFSLGCLVFSRLVLGAFGAAFTDYDSELAIVLAGRVLFCTLGLPTVFLSMLGHSRQLVACQALGILINIGLNVALIPRFGVAGAAVATAVSIAAWKTVAAITVWRLHRINVSVFSTRWVAGT